jgi:uncharacterized protein YqfA (UPF0365 family)
VSGLAIFVAMVATLAGFAAAGLACITAVRIAELRAKHAIDLARATSDGAIALARAAAERTAESEAEDLDEMRETVEALEKRVGEAEAHCQRLASDVSTNANRTVSILNRMKDAGVRG